LKQLPLLEAQAGWSGVYTVPAVRSRVCGADVREQGGAPCILDTVKPEGLEKVLARADVLVLPTLCLLVASKVAHLMCDEPDSRLVFSALLQGKPVLAARDGFMVCEVLANEALKTEMERLINKLEGFGVVFCPTQQLAEAFGRLTSDFIPENEITR
jgi:glycosyltransferase involved in cell wall biosynthesis